MTIESGRQQPAVRDFALGVRCGGGGVLATSKTTWSSSSLCSTRFPRHEESRARFAIIEMQ
jgi:hypothetical protein